MAILASKLGKPMFHGLSIGWTTYHFNLKPKYRSDGKCWSINWLGFFIYRNDFRG